MDWLSQHECLAVRIGAIAMELNLISRFTKQLARENTVSVIILFFTLALNATMAVRSKKSCQF
jgi:hypothetical protein